MYQVIELVPDQDYLRSISDDEIREIDINLVFNTQFDKNITKKFKAFIF